MTAANVKMPTAKTDSDNSSPSQFVHQNASIHAVRFADDSHPVSTATGGQYRESYGTENTEPAHTSNMSW